LVARHWLPCVWDVSAERIRIEFLKLLIGDYFHLVPKEVFVAIIPEIKHLIGCQQNSPRHLYDVYDHTMVGVQSLVHHKDPILSLSHLLHDIAKPQVKTTTEDGRDHFYLHEENGANMATLICYKLKLRTVDTDRVWFLIDNHLKLGCEQITKKAVRRFINKIKETNGVVSIIDPIHLMEADYAGMRPAYREGMLATKKFYYEILDEMDNPVKPLDSPLDGSEIMELFGVKGEDVGKIKSYLKSKVVDGELNQDDKETAIKLAKEFKNG
jgi:tRNA nucleotidyltransferase (CCA-adding enzyme)